MNWFFQFATPLSTRINFLHAKFWIVNSRIGSQMNFVLDYWRNSLRCNFNTAIILFIFQKLQITINITCTSPTYFVPGVRAVGSLRVHPCDEGKFEIILSRVTSFILYSSIRLSWPQLNWMVVVKRSVWNIFWSIICQLISDLVQRAWILIEFAYYVE